MSVKPDASLPLAAAVRAASVTIRPSLLVHCRAAAAGAFIRPEADLDYLEEFLPAEMFAEIKQRSIKANTKFAPRTEKTSTE